jgi:hypothetical protein
VSCVAHIESFAHTRSFYLNALSFLFGRYVHAHCDGSMLEGGT